MTAPSRPAAPSSPEDDEDARHPVARYLLPSERCVFAVRRHPMMMWLPALATYLSLMVVAFVWLATPQGSSLPTAALLVAAGCTTWLGIRIGDWALERLVVTDKRMLLIRGLITRKVGMMPLSKVTDMTYERSVVGRVVGYGTFVMESAGQDQALHRVAFVPDPDVRYGQVAGLLFGPPRS